MKKISLLAAPISGPETNFRRTRPFRHEPSAYLPLRSGAEKGSTQ